MTFGYRDRERFRNAILFHPRRLHRCPRPAQPISIPDEPPLGAMIDAERSPRTWRPLYVRMSDHYSPLRPMDTRGHRNPLLWHACP